MLKQESGQALPIVLLVLALGTATIMPAMVYANAAIIAQHNAKQALVDQSSADSCNTYVMWKLLYDTSFMNSITGTTTETCTINGVSVPVTIDPVPTSSVISATATYNVTNYPLLAGHEIWAISSAPTTGDNGGVLLAHDTTGTPSQVTVPFTTGSVTYYLHNNPTPPNGNVSVPAAESSAPWTDLTMTTTAPTATTLYNYDVGHDTLTGRWIETSNDGAQCSSKVSSGYRYRVAWRSPVAASTLTINGTVTFRWWWGFEDLGFASNNNVTWWLCDFDTALPFSDTGARNPVNLFSPSGKVNASPNVWKKPFDLRTVVELTKLYSRVDRVSDTAIAVRSWQLSGS